MTETPTLSEVVSTVRVTHPGPGLFNTGSFHGQLGHRVHIHGLHAGTPDTPGAVHTLIAAEPAVGPRDAHDPDTHKWSTQDVMGAAAVLTVRTTLPEALDITRHVSVLTTVTPKTVVRVQDEQGMALTHPDRPARLDAFLTEGQQVYVGDTLYRVVAQERPNIDPDSGTATVEDYQLATVRPVDPQPPVQPA